MNQQLSFMNPLYISGAAFSLCKKYRYSLTRIWDDSKNKVLFICLNPSTADAINNDPTIRRCIGFAEDWGYGGLYIANIFAYRATDPKDMKSAEEPVGIKNDEWILELQLKTDIIIAAWGTHGNYLNRDKRVIELLGIDNLHCLEKTINGYPKHPLYLKKDLKPILFKT